MEDNRHLLHPLLPPSTAAAASPPLDDDDNNLVSSNSGIISRLCLVAFIGIISIYANHEASKGYAITIVNESTNTFLANRFKLFYVSNGAAARAAIKASDTIENLLFLEDSMKKPIKSVVFRLVDRSLADNVFVETSGDDRHRFVVSISSAAMGGANSGDDVVMAIRRGVARVWLWDGGGDADNNLVNGIVEYLVDSLDNSSPTAEVLEPAAAACLDTSSPRLVAEFLRRRPGLVGRLNQAIKEGWNDGKLGGALGLPVDELCAASHESLRYDS